MLPHRLVLMLHVEIVLKAKQPEAETSLVYDVFIRGIRKESKKKNEKTCKACEE